MLSLSHQMDINLPPWFTGMIGICMHNNMSVVHSNGFAYSSINNQYEGTCKVEGYNMQK